ncbi:putative ubiquitin-conjugating enzyme E2 26 [Hordeum vulgare]|nr:putative ubiquitin-conjugating enzyme E2 26 [Hordeum vulgare]
MEFGVHLVETHMRKMDLVLVYTNDPAIVSGMIRRFANSPDYRFAKVDTINDLKVLKTTGFAYHKIVDILGHYKIWGSKKDMDYHVDLAEAIIDPYYRDMKTEGEKNKLAWHSASVKRLDEHHLHIASKEAYTCYEMFRRIVDMRNCLLP